MVHAHGDCLGDLALGAMAGPVAELECGLQSNAAEAQEIESGAQRLQETQARIIADGVVTPAERRQLARVTKQLNGLAKVHRTHAVNLAG